jgi:hypothetical protein
MKCLLLIAGLLAGTIANAQEDETRYDRAMKDYPARIGIKAGINSANITVDNAGNVADRRAIPAWHAGVVADFPLLPVLSIQPALLLNSKGAKFRIGDEGSANYTEVRMRPLYLELPVNAVVKIPLPNKVRLFAGAGPYIAYGLGGKIKTEGKLLGISFSEDEKIEYGNDDPANGSNGSRYKGNLKRFDMGVNLMAGLEIGHLMLNAGYGYGLMNIHPGSDNDDAKYQNRVGSVSVGIML